MASTKEPSNKVNIQERLEKISDLIAKEEASENAQDFNAKFFSKRKSGVFRYKTILENDELSPRDKLEAIHKAAVDFSANSHFNSHTNINSEIADISTLPAAVTTNKNIERQ